MISTAEIDDVHILSRAIESEAYTGYQMRAVYSILHKTKAKYENLSTLTSVKYFQIRTTNPRHCKAAIHILEICD